MVSLTLSQIITFPTLISFYEGYGVSSPTLLNAPLQSVYTKLSTMTLLFLFSILLLPCLCLLSFLLHRPTAFGGRSPPLPPGPRPLPIIGSLHLLGPLPHRAFSALAKSYGPLMHLRLGSVTTVVASSPETAELFLKTHDAAFANRPPSEVFRHISYGYKGLSFSDSGPYWRHIRRLCVTNLLSPQKIDSYRTIRKQETDLFAEKLNAAATNREAVDVSAAVGKLVSDVACRIILGSRYMSDDEDAVRFKENTDELMNLLGSFNVNDAVPVLRVFDVQGMRKRMRKVHQVFDVFLEKIIDEHVKSRGKGEMGGDFVDIMLSIVESEEEDGGGFRFGRSNIKAVVLDMLEGSMETSRTAVDWAFTELLRYPRVLNKVREELAVVVGRNRQVEESDIPKLEYLAMVLKESLRLHPLIALLFHRGKEECVVNGYKIPKGSNLVVNLWAITRDPEVWPDPEEFVPERFAEENIDVRGQDYRFTPFGSGRRICVGIQFALSLSPLILAQMVHCFDWELPVGVKADDLDMTERYGLTLPRAEHLWATPIKRLT